ncbi:2OG-Fe(II) oxygenase [Saccharicrinis fermentans]|uniref:Fe(II)-dependent oxygenase superfamily protein n=1 Tax=Saccharicrinis fermentans DSM 9555 = JCM 21142 TaxID=869213 RepID=W7YAS5_9BACT|nr:2OG-Fe(II) oxygenase [Saccharicrinis fermentans]GAF05487.1 Fe(II)-dependent oxygenase superfamily protein [Saccharicrinis fermentans DSM 9555 = JCM 21142]
MSLIELPNRKVIYSNQNLFSEGDLSSIYSSIENSLFAFSEVYDNNKKVFSPEERKSLSYRLDSLPSQITDTIMAEVSKLSPDPYLKIIDWQIIKYPTGGYFKLHQDKSEQPNINNPKVSNRCFTFVVLLNNDFEGGKLVLHAELNQGSNYCVGLSLCKNRGDLIIFSSELFHEVQKITKGTRLTLVGWIGIN